MANNVSYIYKYEFTLTHNYDTIIASEKDIKRTQTVKLRLPVFCFVKNKKFLKANSHISSLIVIKTKRGNKMDALVTAAKNGDKEAFVQLIRMNKQSLYKAAWVYLRNEQDIADALQNTILSCYENIQGLREVKYFKTWLMRILINECKDIFRQKNHDTELDNFAEGVHCEELDLCEWKQLLLCLDEESRKIVELYYFDEFSVKEISALLEMNSNTVSTKLSRARAKLKKVIRR